MVDDIQLALGYDGIEYLIAQLYSVDNYTLPYQPQIDPSGVGSATWGKIAGTLSDQKDLQAVLDKLQQEIDDAIAGVIKGVFTYKGTVATVDDLPSNAEVGDCYNVADTGANYAWSGTNWDKLSETIDLSNYLEREEFEETIQLYYTKAQLDSVLNTMKLELDTDIAQKADKSDLNNEIALREAGDEALDNRIDLIVNQINETIIQAIENLNTALANEKTARENADTALGERIDTVESDINALDEKLTAHIEDEEANAATKAELAEETNARLIADNLLQEAVDLKADKTELENFYDKDAVDALFEEKTATLFNYKGQVETVNDLPVEGNKTGDTYNVIESGANYTWNGSAWDKLSETIDLSPYAKTTDVNALVEAEAQARQGVDATLQTNIDKVASDLAEHIADADQNAATKAELAQAVSSLEDADTTLQTNIDKVAEDLQKHIDEAETGYVTHAELNQEISDRQAADDLKVDKTDIFQNGVFTTTNTKSNGTFTKIWNEADGGGTQIIDGVTNVQAYTGVHEGSDGTNIYVQTYAVDKNTKVGTRININKEGAFLTVGKNTYTFNADDAILTKKDLKSESDELQAQIDANKIKIANLESIKADVTALNAVSDALTTDIGYLNTTLSNHITQSDADIAELKSGLADEVTARENADQLLEDSVDALSTGLRETKQRVKTLEDTDFVEYTDISTAENPDRKAIVLNNHDGIFGKDTDGNTRLLAMMSKYNVADFGAKDTHTNLNTKQIVTINDTQAVITDKNLEQMLLPGENIVIDKQTVTDPSTGFEFNTFTINAELEGTNTKLDEEVRDRIAGDEALDNKIDALADDTYRKNEVYTKEEIDNITSAIFRYKGQVETASELPQSGNEIGDVYNVVDSGSNYCWNGTEWDKLSETIDLTPYMTKEEFNQAILDYYTKEEIDNKEKALLGRIWTNVQNPENGYFKTEASTSKGKAIIWNEPDGGGSKYEGKDGLWSYTGVNEGTANKVSDLEGNILSGRANEVMGQIYVYDSTNTISEKGNKGAWIDMTLDGFYYKKGANSNVTLDNEIATTGNVKVVQENVDTLQGNFDELQETVDNSLATQDGNIQALLLQMETLQRKIEDLKSLDYEVVVLYDGSDTEYTNKEKDFQLSGSVNAPLIIAGRSTTLKEAVMKAVYSEILVTEDITIKDVEMTGTLVKSSSNAIFKLHSDGYVTVRDCKITPESAYNGIEVNLTQGLAKSVIIDNLDFDGHFINNGISIFGMAEGGVVTISNCHFKELSNILRISNRTNSHWTVNLINCTCDKWESGQYAGAILLQDYTSGSRDEANRNNIFAKLTINIQNLTKPDGTKLVAPDDMADICSTQNDNQIIYMWDEWRNFTEYGEYFPTINIQ